MSSACSLAMSEAEKTSFSVFFCSGNLAKRAKFVVMSSSRMAQVDIWVMSCLYLETVE